MPKKISQTDVSEFLKPVPPVNTRERIITESQRRFSYADRLDAQIASALTPHGSANLY